MESTPLKGIKVIDFTQVRAGPWCTQLLSEMGAEVIKIERPDVGDISRDASPSQAGMAASYISRNRNKKSVTLNLKSDEGQAIAKALIADADVLVENFSTGVMDRFGLGYEYLSSEVNQGLVYGSIKGYGEKGPYSDKRGVDLVMQAEAGMMSVTGTEDGTPIKMGQAIGDIGAGLYCTIGILAALYERGRTGEGDKFETNLFGTMTSFLEEYFTIYGITGENPKPRGTRHQTGVPYELFETKDGYLVLSALGADWETFCTEILNDESLVEYRTNELRQKHYDEIMAVMRPQMKEKTTEAWSERLEEHGFPVGPLNHVSDVVDHPQTRARNYVFEYDDPEIGEVILHGHPLHFERSDTEIRSGPPRLGQHTEEVLRSDLGLDTSEIEDLHERDII